MCVQPPQPLQPIPPLTTWRPERHRVSPCHTQDGDPLRADPAPPGFALSDTALNQWQAESRAGRPIEECRGRVRARGAPGLPSRAAVGPGRRERGVGGMARRLRAAMALLLLQALPEGLPAGAEPAQVRGRCSGGLGSCRAAGGLRPWERGGCECGGLCWPLGRGPAGLAGCAGGAGGRGFGGPA